MPLDVPQENTGLIEGRRPGDWIAGSIPYEARNPSGDWRPYLPKEEKQYSNNVDTMGCVSFSHNNSLEIQTKFLTGKEVNYSDRFLAKVSGTTHDGNWLYKVADAVRQYGLVREEEWTTTNYTWASYYASIPQSVIDKAEQINEAYEWIPIDSLKHHLKQAPIQITIPLPYPNHAVVLVHINGSTAYYFDTYSPYLKTIPVSKISSALKVVLTLNSMNKNIVIYKNGSEYIVGTKMTSEQGFAQKLVETGCYDLLNSDGNPDFGKIDKIAHVL